MKGDQSLEAKQGSGNAGTVKGLRGDGAPSVPQHQAYPRCGARLALIKPTGAARWINRAPAAQPGIAKLSRLSFRSGSRRAFGFAPRSR